MTLAGCGSDSSAPAAPPGCFQGWNKSSTDSWLIDCACNQPHTNPYYDYDPVASCTPGVVKGRGADTSIESTMVCCMAAAGCMCVRDDQPECKGRPSVAGCDINGVIGSSSTPDGGTGTCSMKTGSCESASDCTCGASCGVVAVCASCSKRCNFYCESDADCEMKTKDLVAPRKRCVETGPSSGTRICE